MMNSQEKSFINLIQSASKTLEEGEDCQQLQKTKSDDIQQEQIKKEILKELKQGFKKCANSILDAHFQENLIKSFESQIKKSKSYTSSDYNQFKNKLLQIASEFKVDNYEMKRQLNSALGQSQDYYNKILNIRSKIHSIYIPELMHLLEKNKAAKNVVEGKDIIVIFGISGAGKSTLVQMMLKYQFVLEKTNKGLTTLVPKEGLKPEHKQFVAKSSTKSIPKYVSAIQLNIPNRHQHFGEIFLVDTPGFFDNEGLVVDANNSLSTIRTLGSANSVRFILLINQRNWGTRGEGFKKLAKVISKLFKKYSASKVIYFLNCFTDDQLCELPTNMKEIQKSLNEEEKGDNKFFAVVNHFCSLMKDAEEKAKDKKMPIRQAIKQHISQLVVMDPEKVDIRQIYLKVLNEQRKIMNPADILDNVVSPEVKQALQNEVSNLDSIISSCIKKDKIDAALYYINNLSQIAQQTKEIGDIGQAQRKLDNLKASLQENFNKQFKKLEKTMQGQVLALRISEAAMNETKQDFNKLVELEKTYRKIPLFENFNKSQDIQRLVQYTSQILENKIQEQLSEDLIQTIYVFSDKFNPKLKETFINNMKTKIKNATQQIKDVINAEDYINLEQKIDKFQQLRNLVSKNKDFAQISSGWKSDLQKKIDKRVTTASQIFDRYGGQFRQIKDSDVKYLKDTLEIFSKANQYSQNPQIKKIADKRKQIKKECLALCRKFILEIIKIIRHNTDSIRYETIQDVTRCKANIVKIMKQINQIQDELQSEFSYELNSIVGLISSKIQAIDTEMNKIQKDSVEDWGAVKNIHNSIKMLKKLSYVCQEAQRKQCMKTINQSEQNLTNKLNDFLTEMQGTVFSIETPHSTVSRLMNAYKISILQKDSKRSVSRKNQQEEQLQDEDIVIIACTKVKYLIRQKIYKILEEIHKFVDQKMTKQHLQYFDGQIPTAIKIKKIYDEVKFTNFQPQAINNQIIFTMQKYFKALREIFRQICGQISSFMAKYQQAVNGEMNQISRDQIYRIIKLKKTLDKLQKNSQLNSILENFGIVAADENEKIKDGLQNLQQNILTKFSQKLKDSSTIKICFDLINSFENLKYLDNTFESRFQKLFGEFKEKLNKNLEEQGYDINPSQFIKPGNIDLFTFKKVYDFLKSYAPNTSQGNKYKRMMERLKTQIKEQERALQPIFYKHYGFNTNIDDAEIEKIYGTIKKHLETVAQINQIVKEQQKLKINEKTLSKISNVGRRIIENCERRIKNKIEEGGNGYNQAQDLIQKIGCLQSMLLEFEIKQFQEYISERQVKLGKGIAEYYCQYFDQRIQQRLQKYVKCQVIALDSLFAVEFQTFTLKQKDIIKDKVETQIHKQIEDINQRCKSKSIKQLKAEFKQAIKKIKYLPRQMRYIIKQSIDQAVKTSIEEKETQSDLAQKQFNF